jgi:hypothetical protein
MRFLLTCLVALTSLSCFGQSYSVDQIPDSVQKKHNSVLREDRMTFEVIDPGLAIQKVKMVRTILNKHADQYQDLVVGYDDLTQINQIAVTVFDKSGKQVKSYKMKHFDDRSAYNRISMLTDNRLKTFSVNTVDYPITIAFEYEIESHNLMFYPGFYFDSGNEPVEHAEFKVVVPTDLGVKYKEVNMDPPEITNIEDKTQYIWSKNNSDKVEREPYGPSFRELLSVVYLTPNRFEIEGIEGRMDDWEVLGNFQFQLNQGLEGLSAQTREKIIALTADAGSTEEKIRRIYQYLQENVRYVSVQLGVGGWRPFSPKYVEENGYGDCKALTYYTKTLLATVGIPSNYSLVYAGDTRIPLDHDFPMRSFNHAILCVPNDGDTLWLECTSQTNPFGYNGSFTGDRQVLVVNKNESKVVRTPTYTLNQNTQFRKGKISIDAEGNASMNIVTDYSGLQYENDNLHFALHFGQDKQHEWLVDHFDMPDFKIVDYEMSQAGDRLPSATIKANIESSSILTHSGSRSFLTPNLLNQWTYIPKRMEDRETEVRKQNAFRDIDSLWFELPPNYYPEYLLEPVKISSEFGNYEISMENKEGKLLYVRKLEMYKGVFPPESYDSLRSFYSEIKKADKSKIVLQKGT